MIKRALNADALHCYIASVFLLKKFLSSSSLAFLHTPSQTLISSLKVACELLTEDEEGGPARIPFDIFVKLYTYLAHLEGDMPQDHINNFLGSLQAQV